MKQITALALALLLSIATTACNQGDKAGARAQEAASQGEQKEGLALGDPIPAADVPMKSVGGEMVTIGDVAGEKGTLVIITCNHCPYVKAWASRTVALANEAQKMGFGVIAINANDPSAYAEDGYEHMVERAEDEGMEYPYVVDATSDVARAFGAERTPEIFLFDGESKLVYHGAVDDNAQDASAVEEPYLEEALNALAQGRQVPVAETKAIGCSIKFRTDGEEKASS